jgi:hypothetical protein
MFTMYSMPFVIFRARDLVLEHCSRALCVSARTDRHLALLPGNLSSHSIYFRVGAGRFGRAAGQSDRVFGPHEWTRIRARPKINDKDWTDRRKFGLELAWDRPDPSVLGRTDRRRRRGPEIAMKI